MVSAPIRDVLRRGGMHFPRHPRVKPDGLQWAASYEIARRGGLASVKRIEPQAVGGYLQSLRGKNSAEIKKSIEESRNGFGRSHHFRGWVGLGVVKGAVARPTGFPDEPHIAKVRVGGWGW